MRKPLQPIHKYQTLFDGQHFRTIGERSNKLFRDLRCDSHLILPNLLKGLPIDLWLRQYIFNAASILMVLLPKRIDFFD